MSLLACAPFSRVQPGWSLTYVATADVRSALASPVEGQRAQATCTLYLPHAAAPGDRGLY